ncbi:MAG: Na+/H+ antiporter NhaC family protein [Clostridiales Family XIII bacterium]|jgi:Na+/H+ antiporter NhaC|nr:Na+/H+ antiporter NhaC family protein [Clostridiales Family XIII bacterium]
MKGKKLRLLLAAAVVLAAVIIPLAVFAADEGAEEYVPAFFGTWVALVPAVVAIALALITKEVYSALFFGVLVGGIFWGVGHPDGVVRATAVHVFQDGFLGTITDSYNMAILVFTTVLGVLVVMMNRSGGAAAFGRWAQENVKSRVGAQIVTVILGCIIFIDDYFNCLTVGTVMRPITDTHKISRAKLSYLIDSTAAPICIIAPISTWAAAVSGFAKDAGNANPFQLFLNTIPYNFYALLTIFFVFALVLMKLDYGPMRKHEVNALNGDVYTTPDRPFADAKAEEVNPKGRVLDLAFPVITLVVTSILGLVHSGGFFSGDSNFIDSFANASADVGLMYGAVFALIITIIYFMIRGTFKFTELMQCIPDGWRVMAAGELILIFAWTINSTTGSIGAADFVYEALQGSAAGLMNMLPAIIFLVACGLAFATGTSWGTFGILIPIVISVFAKSDPQLMIIGMSACMAGGVFGDHCSPISDTTVLSSTGAQSNHLNHVTTQMPYAITVGAVTFVGFVIAGFARTPLVSLAVGVVVLLLVLFYMKKRRGSAEAEAGGTPTSA